MSKTINSIHAGTTNIRVTYRNNGLSFNNNDHNITVAKASNQITITPTSKTIYSTSGYNSFTITVSNYKGTVTASSSNTSKATVAKVDNGTFTVTYAGAGSATITVTDDGGTNYVSSSATSTVTTIADYVTNSDYNSSNSNYTVNVTIGSGLNAGVTEATVTVTGSHTHTYYKLYASGYVTGPHTSNPSDSPSWSITSQYINSSGNTITRFSKDGSKLKHATMGTTTGTDYVTITANNNGTTKTASTNVTNSLGTQHYKNTSGTTGDNYTYGTPTESSITIGSGLSAAGGSAALSCSTKDTKTYYRKYDSGTYTSLYTENPASSITWTISSQSCAGGTNRYSVSGSTLSHSTMGSTTGTDSVTVQAANANSTSLKATKSTTVTNSLGTTKYKNTSGTEGYNITYVAPSCTLTNNLTAADGSVTVTCTVTNNTNWYQKYTSGSYTSLQSGTEAGTARWRITSNGNSRFSHPSSGSSNLTIGGSSVATYATGTAATHSNMTTNVTTDTVGITAYNVGDTTKTSGEKTASVTNSLDTTKYKNTSGTEGYNITYKNPSISKSGTLSASNGELTITCSVTNNTDWYQRYTSGSYTSQQTGTEAGTARWMITSNGNSRFTPSGTSSSLSGVGTVYNSGGKVIHSNMTSNVATDSVTVTAYNIGDTTKTAAVSDSVTNSLGTTKYKNTSGTEGYNITYVAPSCTIGSGLTAAGGSATVTCAVTNNTDWYQRYTSGSYTAKQTGTETGTARWMITSNGNSRFSHPSSGGTSLSGVGTVYNSGTSVSHSSMTTNDTTDTVTVTAYNIGDTSKTKTASVSITNPIITTQKYKNTSGTTGYNVVYVAPQTCTITNNLTAAGGSFTVTCAVTNNTNWYYKYTSGSYTSQQTGTETGTAKWQITTNGNNRFSNPSSGGATVGSYTLYPSGGVGSHSNMTTNATTDSVTVTAYNIGDTSKTKTASASVTNILTWSNPVLTVSSPVTPYSMAVSGETKAITASATQSGSYTSGSTASATPDITYEVKTAVTGYSLSSNKVTVTNNTSTSARNGFVVTVKASKNNKTATSDRTFNQAAGAKVYEVPTISAYSYATYAAAGATKTPTVTYSQPWTWNGVSGSGGTITSGGTLAFTKGTLTSGATAGSSFATDGSITWANNTTTSSRSTHSVLNVTVTLNSKTSSAKTCTACTQSAGAKVYGTPTVTFTYTNTAASGVTNKAPTTVTYSQPWTWNGVSGSGGNITSGLTLSYSTTGTLPTGFSKGTNFATTGAITWASRGTTVGSQLNANSNIVLSIPFADQTRTYNPTGCTQSANALTGISISFGSNPINYNTTTTATVTATYTSGSSKDVTSSLSTSSSATSNFIKSGNTSIVTVS